MAGGGSKPGERRGGKQVGSRNLATKDAKLALEDLAKEYAPEALKVLAEVMAKSQSDPARVAAANGLLDRGYGKPRQAMEISGDLKLRTMSDADLDAAIARLLAKS